MKCRMCGACCIAPSITSPLPGMPNGKPAMIRCVHLTENMLCDLWEKPERPLVCMQSKADPLFCGKNFDDAVNIFLSLE